MKSLVSLMLLAAFAISCNNSADKEEVNQDSLSGSPLDNRDVNNRNTAIYDSVNQHPGSDTSSYERMPTKVPDSLK